MLAHHAATLTKLALLAAALGPLTLVNLRTGNIPKGYNLFLFAAGVAWMGLAHAMGWTASSLAADLGWLAVEAPAFYVGLALLKFPGGSGKAIVALTPWFAFWTLIAICAFAMLWVVALGRATGRKAMLFAPPLLVASLAAALL